MQAEHQFLLVCESTAPTRKEAGSWKFVVEYLDGTHFLEASDCEAGDRNRLGLLSVVRGLESLPGGSEVTVLSTCRHVIRSMSEKLPRWRAADYCWENFGRRTPITNADLWQRIARALDIHSVSACCVAPHHAPPNAQARENPRHAQVFAASDSLRRWLVSQCQTITGNFETVDSPAIAVA